MKISKRDLGLLMLLLGVIIIVVVYNFVYTENNEKAESIEAETTTLRQTESQLAELEANMDYYQSEITRMSDEDENIMDEFPANILPENEIMYAVELEENNDIYFSAISYGSAAAISTGLEDTTGITGYDLPMALSYQSTYQGLKDVITYNNDQNYRRVISAVTASYDSTTGNLSGSMTLDQYYMTGTDAVYSEPYVPAISTGTDNIFGTIEIPVNSDTEEE